MRGASYGSCTCLGVPNDFLKAVRTLTVAVGRTRPSRSNTMLVKATASGSILASFRTFTDRLRRGNFPGSFYPKMELLLMFCASSVALSRIVLGLHFLSDILAGPAIGEMVGYLCRPCYRPDW